MYVTSRFILSQETKTLLKKRPHKFGFGLFGEIAFYRSYSRLKSDGSNESWYDVVVRVTEGIFSIKKDYQLKMHLPWNEEKMQSFAKNFATAMYDKKWMPPGRGLWIMGTDYIYERGSAALYNCAAVDTSNLALAADWAIDMLMVGAGVGFNTAWDGKAKKPDKSSPKTFVVPDSKEGWSESIKLLIESYTKDSPFYRFDYSRIRPAGTPLKSFGGVAAGPEPLKKLHHAIESILDRYIERKIDKTRAVVDIFNEIGICVASGNIRRSAEIAIGEPNDPTFLNLKDYEKYPDRFSIGWVSNNSVLLKDIEEFGYLDAICQHIHKNGEPGILHLYNMQHFGRFGQLIEDRAWLSNPCGEIALESFELCNLAEIFISKCSSLDEFLQMVRYATFYASTVNLLPTHRPETNKIIARNRRIGVSVSGIADAIEKIGLEKVVIWLRKGYEEVRRVNEILAKESGIPISLKVTAIKPSGTISILGGTSPGMHYPFYRYALRRIHIAKNSPLAQKLIEAGIDHEEDMYDSSTLVFAFPIQYDNPRSLQEVDLVEQFVLLATLQREWADNMVSNTLQFDPKKYNPKDLARLLKHFLPMLKSTTLLPKVEKIYSQMPFEAISKVEYIKRIEKLKGIMIEDLAGHYAQHNESCSRGSCTF